MQKTYVLDTNVLLQAPYALLSFEENNLVLPVVVLEELDKLKTEEGEVGANARETIRFLERYRVEGNLTEGVVLPTGGVLRIEVNHLNVKTPDGFKENQNDNRILKVCRGLIEEGEAVTLVTKDIIARIKAQMMDIPAEDFITDQAPVLNMQYSGRLEAYIPDELISEFKKNGVKPEHLYKARSDGNRQEVEVVKNQFFILNSDQSKKKSLLGRFDGERVMPLSFGKKKPFGAAPRNVGQYFMQEALMLDAETAPLVIVKGPAGTAKTFYALAVGLERILESNQPSYRRILITRPNVQFDDEIGFLPGTEQEKISPLLRPIIDNLEILVDSDEKERYSDERALKDKIDELFDRGVVTAEAMNFIRGRSIAQTYLIIDEAQNLTPKQVKGIITRAGKGTKVILLGDPKQIDHPLLDERTNGLSYAAEKMKGSAYCFQINMKEEECERSQLAKDAALRM